MQSSAPGSQTKKYNLVNSLVPCSCSEAVVNRGIVELSMVYIMSRDCQHCLHQKRKPAAMQEVDGLINPSQTADIPRRGKKQLCDVVSGPVVC